MKALWKSPRARWKSPRSLCPTRMDSLMLFVLYPFSSASRISWRFALRTSTSLIHRSSSAYASPSRPAIFSTTAAYDRVSSPCFNRSCAERSASRPRASSSECSATNKRRETAARGAYALTIDSRSTGGGESSASIVKRCGRGGAREEARGRSKATTRLPALKTKHFIQLL